MPGKELGDATRHRLWTLHVQEVSHAFDPAALDLWEPGMKQLIALDEQLPCLCAYHREYRP